MFNVLFLLRVFLFGILFFELSWSVWSIIVIDLRYLVGLVSQCHRSFLNYKLYAVLSVAFVRSLRQNLCVFFGEFCLGKFLGF